jgi:hypothetical protein
MAAVVPASTIPPTPPRPTHSKRLVCSVPVRASSRGRHRPTVRGSRSAPAPPACWSPGAAAATPPGRGLRLR